MTEDHVQPGPSIPSTEAGVSKTKCVLQTKQAPNIPLRRKKKQQAPAKEDLSLPPALRRAHQDGKATNKASLFSSQPASQKAY